MKNTRKASVTLIVLALLSLSGCIPKPVGNQGGSATLGSGLVSMVSIPFRALAPKPTAGAAPSPAPAPAGEAKMGDVASIHQPGNPGAPSTQSYGFSKEEEITYSQPTQIVTEVKQPDGSSIVVTENVPAGSKKKSSVVQNVGQVIGASQIDTTSAFSAKIASFKFIQWIGAIGFLFGVVSFFHPALRLIVGGKDTALAIAGAGLVMIFGPVLFVTYEKYFFLAILAAAAYWFFSRSKYKEGLLDSFTRHPDSS